LPEARDVGQIPCNVRAFREELFTLWRCTGCGSLHCAEAVDLGRYYADYPLKKQRLTFSERVGYRNRLRLLERAGFDRSDRILDFGCGAGLFVRFLQDLGLPRVFGYDAFVPAHADPRRLEESYEAIVSFDVIEHADDPRAFLGSLTRLLRPGGLFLIGTPNADNVSLARKLDPSLHPPYHRHILAEKILLSLGREVGLEVTRISRRSFYDSLVPTVNSRFMWRYVERRGALDAAVEPPHIGVILRSPDLWFLAFFGYFFPRGDNLLVTFRKN
jgi:SAM-dependent methyltransferase